MNFPERLADLRTRIGRNAEGIALATAVAALGLLGWNQGRMNREIAELKGLVRQAARSPAPAPEADRAIALGRKAIGEGRWDLGQIYLANAVTNSPGDIRCLREYATIVLERPDPPGEALDRLVSMLQLAAYQVDPDQIAAVASLVDDAERARCRSCEPTDGVGSAAKDDPHAEWARLSQVGPDLWKDESGLSAHLQEIEAFLSRLDAGPGLPRGLRSAATSELLRWNQVAQAIKQCTYIDLCLARLRGGEDLSSQRAVAIVQAAENALPALWGLDAVALPAGLRKKIDDYPEAIQGLIGRIAKSRSGPILKQIRDAMAGDVPEEGPWQEKCDRIEQQIRAAQQLAVHLTSPEAMQEARALVESRTAILQKYKNNQFYAYQAWAIARCDQAFQKYMKYNFGLSEADARSVFRESQLAEIDQSLLSPEVARVFNDVLGKLTAEMGPKELVATEKEIGTTTKTRPEAL